jgi:GAF domain-containing protein
MADILRITAGLGDSETRRLLGAHDWHSSPLGPPESWPPELATAVSMALSSTFPMFLAWGPQQVFLYNDAYVPVLGDKHPSAFGELFHRVWWEIWADLGPIAERAMANQSSYFEDMPLTMERKGYTEQTWFTFSYSPLHDGEGRVMGMYCTCIETTARVEAERRAAFELALADALRPLASSEDAIATASALLGRELGVEHVMYGEVDDARNTFYVLRDWKRRGSSSLSGNTFAIEAFGEDVAASGRAGEVVAITDVRLDARTMQYQQAYLTAMGVSASLLVPLVKSGRLLAFLALGHEAPHRWSEAEIALARSMAERLWTAVDLARAHEALREERDRSQGILELDRRRLRPDCRRLDRAAGESRRLRLSSRTAEQALGRNHWDVWPEAVDTELGRMYHEVQASRVAGRADYLHRMPDGQERWFEVRAYPTGTAASSASSSTSPSASRPRTSCAPPTSARTSSWRCWRTSCATRWRRSAPPPTC